MRTTRALACLSVAFGLTACHTTAPSALDTELPAPIEPRPIAPEQPLPDGGTDPDADAEVPDPAVIELAPAPLQRVVPTDARPVHHGELSAKPISGGTLLVTGDGQWAVAADPERDRVSLVDIAGQTLGAHVALQPGDEPGRLVEDDMQRVHVVLRGAGAVATLDLATSAVVQRRSVCRSPRGIDFDASRRELLIACTSGELQRMPVDSGDAAAFTAVDVDARDVMRVGDRFLVSRFKSAELLALDASGAAAGRSAPQSTLTSFPEVTGARIVDELVPNVAWRTRARSDGAVFMVHQGARKGEIDVELPPEETSTMVPISSYGAPTGQCGGVSQTQVSRFDADGTLDATMRIAAPLPVDLALSAPDLGLLAVAQAGDATADQPRVHLVLAEEPVPEPEAVTEEEAVRGNVLLFQSGFEAGPSSVETPCFAPFGLVRGNGQPTAVAFTPDGGLVVQTREPAAVWLVSAQALFEATQAFDFGAGSVEAQHVALGGESVLDTGHELFHRDAGAGIACASCHPEGGDDGHVWKFSDVGARRTQALDIGLADTAPFHWDGTLSTVKSLMDTSFIDRMGGVHQSDERASALEAWVLGMAPPRAMRDASDAAALRGAELFSGAAECATCHVNASFTDNQTRDIGTGQALQVPSLVGVAQRPPFMHAGCAQTLDGIYDEACGGAAHASASALTDAQRADLNAFMQTL